MLVNDSYLSPSLLLRENAGEFGTCENI